ncbi:MAG: response regulator, partial [Verrucomicrobiota bacterium]
FPATDALPETNALEKSPIPDGHGQRILYIDDEEPLVNLVKRRFELRGYVVSGFCDPLEAIAAFLAAPERFDVVVTDFNMPTATGLDVAREVLALHPLMPVILTSGYLTEELKTNALRAGIRKLVYKPTSLDKLEEAILESLTRTDSK